MTSRTQSIPTSLLGHLISPPHFPSNHAAFLLSFSVVFKSGTRGCCSQGSSPQHCPYTTQRHTRTTATISLSHSPSEVSLRPKPWQASPPQLGFPFETGFWSTTQKPLGKNKQTTALAMWGKACCWRQRSTNRARWAHGDFHRHGRNTGPAPFSGTHATRPCVCCRHPVTGPVSPSVPWQRAQASGHSADTSRLGWRPSRVERPLRSPEDNLAFSPPRRDRC